VDVAAALDLAQWLWLPTSVFHRDLVICRRGGALIADQSTISSPNRRLGLMRSERNNDRQRHYCTRRNQKDCVLSHRGSVAWN
jgi:hypothetical protein